MTRWKTRLFAFSLTLHIGLASVWFLVPVPNSDKTISPEPARTDLCTGFSFDPIPEAEEFVAEFENIEFDDRTKHPAMLMEFVSDGEAYSCTADSAKEDKKWLALVKRGNQYSLEKRTIEYSQPRRTDFGSFSKMRFADSRSTLLLMTDQGTLRPGDVQTVYLKRPLNEDGMELYADGLEIGDKRTFSLNGSEYGVRVAPATLKGGNKLSALILETGSHSQMIWYQSYWHPTEIGELDWVGDLDGDNKLDLLFTSYAQNGGQLEAFLFLSSFAVDNNLVGFAGNFTARCSY